MHSDEISESHSPVPTNLVHDSRENRKSHELSAKKGKEPCHLIHTPDRRDRNLIFSESGTCSKTRFGFFKPLWYVSLRGPEPWPARTAPYWAPIPPPLSSRIPCSHARIAAASLLQFIWRVFLEHRNAF